MGFKIGHNILTLLISGFALLLPTVAFSEQLVGSIKGNFKVQEGSAHYSIPLDVPPGVAGLQPQLNFNYRSGRSASIMGEGWSLGGTSSIQRCRANKAQDGLQAGVNFTQSDRFCLNGSKLKAISGDYGASGTEYRTNIESFSKIVSYGNAGSGPLNFKVWTKSGRIMEFGNTAESRIIPEGKAAVLSWLINKSSDRNNNNIEYQYQISTADADHAIKQIDYANNSIQFNYTDISSNTKLSYLAGAKLKNTLRLDSVETFVNSRSAPVNTWKLNYQYNSSNSAELLKSIQECAVGGCLPETTFDWLTYGAQGINTSSRWINDFGANTGNWIKGQHPRLMADVNKDGRPDIVAFADNAVQVSLAQDSHFGPSTNWINDFGNQQGWHNSIKAEGQQLIGNHQRSLADVNGDGFPDIVGFSDSGVQVAISTGESFAPKKLWVSAFGSKVNWDIEKASRTLVDVNSDGRADILGFGLDGIYVSLSQGDKFSSPVRYLADLGYNQGWRAKDHVRTLNDVNGDGYLDIVAINDSHVYIALGDGTKFSPKVSWGQQFTKNNGGWDKEKHPRRLADINGDGLADLVGYSDNGLQVALSTGTDFATSSQWSSSYGYAAGWRIKDHQRMIVDVNGDGISDLVGINQDGVSVSYGDGKSFTQAVILTSDFAGVNDTRPTNSPSGTSPTNIEHWYQRSLADVNGDGLLDIIGFHDNGVDVATTQQDDRADRGRSLISAINNGLGHQTKIRYGQMSDRRIYITEESIPAYPYRQVMRASFLVEQVLTDDGISGSFTTAYRYGRALWDASGHGYQGFKWIEQTNQTLGIISTTEYLQQYPFTGRISKNLTAQSNGALISEVVNSYASSALHNGATNFPYLSKSTEKSYQLSGGLISTTTTDFSAYDDYGNLGQRKQVTDGGGKSFTTQDNYNYKQPDANKWLIGLVDEQRQTLSGTNRENTVLNNHYGYDQNGLLQTQTRQPNHVLAVTEQYQRDNFGNIISTTLSGNNVTQNGTSSGELKRTETFSYDTQGLFVVESQNALGHKLNTIYDPSYGNLISQTDVNGITTDWQYDSLGRLAVEMRPNQKNTLYTYHSKSSCSDAPDHTVRCSTSAPEGETPVTVYYDSLNREIRSRSVGFDGRPVFVDKVYNAKGQLEKTSRAYYSGDRRYWATFTYDVLGRVIQQTEPASNGATATTKTVYQGLVTTVTDANNNSKTTTKNVLGQIEQLQDPLNASIRYSYDAQGNLLSTIDDQGNTIQLSYDLLGNKISMDDPDKGYWRYTYNAFGELVYQVDANNQLSAISYDQLGRMVSRQEVGNTNGETVTSHWLYDTAINGIGHLARETGPNNYQKNYQYDHLSRPISATTQLNDGSENTALTVRNEYDAFSRLAKQYRPGATGEFVLEHLYNPQGFLASVRSPKEKVGEYSSSHLTRLINQAVEEADLIIEKAENLQTQVNSYFKKADYYRSLSLIVTPIKSNQSSISVENGENYRIYNDNSGNQYIRNAQEQFAKIQLQNDGGWTITSSSISQNDVTETQQKAYIGDFNRNGVSDLIVVTDGHPAGQHLAASASSLLQVNRDREITERKALLAQASKVLNANSIDISAGDLQLFYNTRDRKRYIRLPHPTRSGGVRMLLGTSNITPVTMPVIQFIELQVVNSQYALERGTDSFADPGFDSNFIATGESVYIGDNNNDGARDLAVARPAEYRAFDEGEVLGLEFFTQLAEKADVVEAVAVFLQKQANDYIQLADNILVLAETSYRQANNLKLWVDNYDQFDLDADYVTFWQAKKRDAEGRLSQSVAGSGLTTTQNYDPATGQLLNIQSGFFYSEKVRDLEYQYDLLNNLTRRADLVQEIQEEFGYDALDRLQYATTNSTLMGSQAYNRTLNYQYDTLGNITDKTGVGSMQYGAGSAGPHAVTSINNGQQFSYDNNGNMLSGNGRTIAWNGADQAVLLSKGDQSVRFSYAPDRSRYLKTSNTAKTLYLDKIYERVTDISSGETSHKNMIYADGKLVAINVETVTASASLKAAVTRYMHYDPLGSIDTITDSHGTVVDRLSFDPFGERRPGDWRQGQLSHLNPFTNRGFTGHEHIDEIGLIHMNGRVFDQELGRFLSADRYVQAPVNTQSFNRYAYVMNNPLKYTDPSGWLFDGNGNYYSKTSPDTTNHNFRNGGNAPSWSDGGGRDKGSSTNYRPSWYVEPEQPIINFNSSHIISISESLPPVDTDDRWKLEGSAYRGFGYSLLETYDGSGLANEGEFRFGVQANADIDAFNSQYKLTSGVLAVAGILNPKKWGKNVTNKVVHKNSLDYVGDAHVYRIKGSDGTYKIGESAQGLRIRDGASIRAEQQVRNLQRQTGEIYESKILKTFTSKRSAVEYQDKLRDRFRRIYGQYTLPGNLEHLRGIKK